MSEDVNAHIKYSCSEGAFIAEKLVGNVGKTIGKYSKDHFSLMPEEAIYISQVQRDSRLYSESNEEINSWKIPHYLTDLSRTLAFSQLRTSGAAIKVESDGFGLFQIDPDRPFRKSDPGPKLTSIKFANIDDDPLALLGDLNGPEVICLTEEGRCHYAKFTPMGDLLKL